MDGLVLWLFKNRPAANPSHSLKFYADIQGVKSMIPGMIWLKVKSQRMETPFSILSRMDSDWPEHLKVEVENL